LTAVELRVLKEGTVLRDDGGAILDASSSVVLVLAEGRTIVVDTGMPRDADALLRALAAQGLRPADVDTVLNTHNHLDHTGCNHVFGRAEVLLHPLEGVPRRGAGRVRHLTGEEVLAPGAAVIDTPGHTRGHVSLLVEARGGPWVVAGDAVPVRDNLRLWVPPGINYDPYVALHSMERIAARARMVVPGHGAPFSVEGARPGPVVAVGARAPGPP